jgi:nucleotide-binding universal stress UspA family protein
MFHKIMVSYDDSSEADRALDAAIKLTKGLQAELHIVTVLEPLPNYFSWDVSTLEGQWQKAAAPASPVDLLVSTLTAFSTDPKLVLPIRKAYIRWQQMLEEDGLDPVQATITRLAIDGLLYIEMFGFNDLTVERRADVMAAVRKMCMGAKNSGKATPKRARMNERNK